MFTLIGPAVGILGLLAAYYFFRYNKERKRLAIEVDSSKLVAEKMYALPEKISVQYDQITVVDPYIVTIQLVNSGKRDVSSKDFDGDKPLAVDLKTKIVALLHTDSESLDVELDPSRVLVAPTLLVRGSSYVINVLVDGMPEVSFEKNRLIETDVLSGDELENRLQKRSRQLRLGSTACLAVMVAALMGMVVVAAIESGDDSDARRGAQREFELVLNSDSSIPSYRSDLKTAQERVVAAQENSGPGASKPFSVVLVVYLISGFVGVGLTVMSTRAKKKMKSHRILGRGPYHRRR